MIPHQTVSSLQDSFFVSPEPVECIVGVLQCYWNEGMNAVYTKG